MNPLFLRLRMMLGGGGTPPPTPPIPGYTRVQYIESTGTQFITALPYDASRGATSYRFKMRARFTEVPSSGYMACGMTSNTAQFFVGLNSNAGTGLYMCFASNTTNTILSRIADNDKTGWHTYEVVFDGTDTKYYVDGVLAKTHLNNLTGIRVLHLFASDNNTISINSYAKMQISEASLSIGGVSAFNFVPVRDGTTGYMYDLVSDTAKGNEGTGDFVVGPDLT